MAGSSSPPLLSSDLDTLLCDLERSIENRTSASNSIPVVRSTAAGPTAENEIISTTNRCEVFTSSKEAYQTSELLVAKEKNLTFPDTKVTMPVSNPTLSQNINELDSLLSDLSNARYNSSQHVERQETVTTMKSTESYVVKAGPISFKSHKTPQQDAVYREIENKNNSGGVELKETNKWGYMGYGVWENGNAPTKASSATQELDELMTSLNTFKLKDRTVEEPVSTNLDDMLGDLRENMDKQGVKTTQKGMCFACQKPIIGQVITAMGRIWHPEHFTCHHCNQELGTQNFFERDGKPYCENDYHSLFSPKCAACNEAILDKCISALEKTWHPEHFTCFQCNRSFDGDGGFHEKEDRAYCKSCFFESFAPKCGGCDNPILENYISSLNTQWHRQCFVCVECGMTFNDGNFFEHQGKPYCETHYHALRGSLCAGCHKPISGRCITAMFRKFHPEHFVCSFCLKQLNKGTFKEQGEKPYCHECYDRLFG